MTEHRAEEAAHARAQAVVSGDFGTTMRFMTPESLAKAMNLGVASWHYTSYELKQAGREGEDYLFETTYQGEDGEALTLRDRFREIDGEWKIADIERLQ